MQTLKSIYQHWLAIQHKIDKEVQNISLKGSRADVETHLKSKFGDNYPNYWIESILPKVVEQIKLVGGYPKAKIIGPCGIGSRVFIEFFIDENDKQFSKQLIVEPNLRDDCETPLYSVDITKDSNEFAKGTVGYCSGLNNEITAIDPQTSGAAWLSFLK
jgi:hypothetical protein